MARIQGFTVLTLLHCLDCDFVSLILFLCSCRYEDEGNGTEARG